MGEIFVGLHSWIIQDGNYPDFKIGDKKKFALEFLDCSLKASDKTLKAFSNIKFERYQVSGQVIFSTKRTWVIDFGYLAFMNFEPPNWAVKNAYFEGEIEIGIDPFFYFEELKSLKEMPNLFYQFLIKQIYLETTSSIEVSEIHFTGDNADKSYREVEETNAWEDENGLGSYVLRCELIGK